jgi:hypothetical protein
MEGTADRALMQAFLRIRVIRRNVVRGATSPSPHCPICKVLSNRLLAVFMTSTLF